MGAIFGTILGFIPGIFSSISEYFRVKLERQAELKSLEHERMIQREQTLKELELDKSHAEFVLAQKQIDKTDKGMRWVMLVIIWAPMIAGAFYPAEVQLYFKNVLGAVPDWWIGMAVGTVVAIFGLKAIERYRNS